MEKWFRFIQIVREIWDAWTNLENFTDKEEQSLENKKRISKTDQ